MFEISLPELPENGVMTAKQARRIIEQLQSLQEYLRYMFAHIGEENLTEELKQQIQEGGESGGLARRVEDAEGNLARLRVEAAGILTRVENAEGAASQAMQTAQGVQIQVTNLAGDIASLDIAASGIMAAVNNNRLRFSAAGLQVINAYGQVVFDQSMSTGNVYLSGDIFATGGSIGGLSISPTGLSYGNLHISVGGAWPMVYIGDLLISGNPNAGMTYGDPEAPVFGVNDRGVYVGRWA